MIAQQTIAESHIRQIIESGFIACVASMNVKGCSCLDLEAALAVVRKSQTKALIYHASYDINLLRDSKQFRWSFTDLLANLPDRAAYVLVANTSRAQTAAEAVHAAGTARNAFHLLRDSTAQSDPVIKLEVLDQTLQPRDKEVIRATAQLLSNGFNVIPLLSASREAVEECQELGVRLIRILVGDIGSGKGIRDPLAVSEVVRAAKVPLFFEGGLGSLDHVREAFIQGASGVLLNTAIQKQKNPSDFAERIRILVDTIKAGGS